MKKIKISYIWKRICLFILSSLTVNKQKLLTFVQKTDRSAICCWSETTGAVEAKELLNWHKIGPNHVEVCSGGPAKYLSQPNIHVHISISLILDIIYQQDDLNFPPILPPKHLWSAPVRRVPAQFQLSDRASR